MKKLNNYDLRLQAGLVLRSDVKAVLNEVIDRLNESYDILSKMETIPKDDKVLESFNQSFYTLDCIFAFLAASGIFSSNTYKEFIEELQKMRLEDIEREDS